MTIINRTLYNHLLLVESLHKLNKTILRMRNPRHEPMSTDLSAMMDDLKGRDSESKIATINRLDTAGDIPRVSEELYNPSSDIFDGDGTITANFLSPSLENEEINQNIGSDNISCTAVYRIKYDSDVYAEIKNYHTYLVTDYSVTSEVYPYILNDKLTTSAFITGGRFLQPSWGDNIISAGQIYSGSYPLEVGYKNYSIQHDDLETAGYMYGASYPLEISYESYSFNDSLNTAGYLYSMSYPLEVEYIVHSIQHEDLNTAGYIYGATFS